MQPASFVHQDHDLGTRLRVLRESRALTMEQLASQANVTKGYLSKLERNLATPSTATLIRICESLGISIVQLNETTSFLDVVRFSERTKISLGGENIYETLLTPSNERRIQVIHTRVGPLGGSGGEEYSLPSEIEFATVLEGNIELRMQGKTHLLHKGDSITFASQEKHSFINPDPSNFAEVLWVISPALPKNFNVNNS